MKQRALVFLLAATGLSLILNGWEAVKTTQRCWLYRLEWKQSGLPYNYGDGWKSELHRLLTEHIRENDEIVMLMEPNPCTSAYGAQIYASYILCPKMLHIQGRGFDPQKAFWFYYPYSDGSVLADLLGDETLARRFQQRGQFQYHTLWGKIDILPVTAPLPWNHFTESLLNELLGGNFGFTRRLSTGGRAAADSRSSARNF